MRNPERIEPMLEAIGHLWSSMPDLRLGQLIEGFSLKATTRSERYNG